MFSFATWNILKPMTFFDRTPHLQYPCSNTHFHFTELQTENVSEQFTEVLQTKTDQKYCINILSILKF